MNNPAPTSARPGPIPRPETRTDASGGVVRRAMGHNRLASAMLIILPTVSVIFVGIFVYLSGILSDPSGPEDLTSNEAARIDSKTVTMDKPRITRFDSKGQSYVLSAKTARQHADFPEVVLLDQVTVDMQLEPKMGVVAVTAARGSFDAEKKMLVLVGNIRVASKKGYRARLSSAKVFLDERRIISQEPVIIIMPRGTIAADKFESTAQKVKLTGNILFDSQDGFRARLASADIDLESGQITSTETVKVDMPNGTIQANALNMTDDGSYVRFSKRTRTTLSANKKSPRTGTSQ